MSDPVALYDVEIGDEEVEAVERVLRSRWLSMGPITEDFESRWATALGAGGAVAVSSGTAALHLAALSLGLEPGDEVIVPSLSFVASTAVFAHTGAVPVFADIRSADDPTIDPGDVAARLTERTRAVVAVHYAGYPADMQALRTLADDRGLALVEDAAHAPLVQTPDGSLGTIGDIGCFSFFATKNLTMAEGGMVVARDPDALGRIRSLRSHALSRSTYARHTSGQTGYDVTALGLNYRPTEISAALGRVQLGRQDRDRERRRDLRAAYERELNGLELPFAGRTGDSANHLMPVLLPPGCDRGAVQAALAGDGVQTSVHYAPTHLFTYYRERYGCAPGLLPVTEDFADRELSLPMHVRMADGDVERVAGALRAAIEAGGGR